MSRARSLISGLRAVEIGSRLSNDSSCTAAHRLCARGFSALRSSNPSLQVQATSPKPLLSHPAPVPSTRSPRKTVPHLKKNGKPYPAHASYRYDLYRSILSQPFVLVLQQLNLTSKDWRAFQRDLAAIAPQDGIRATMVQGKIFRKAGVDVVKEGAGKVGQAFELADLPQLSTHVGAASQESGYYPDKFVKRQLGLGPFLVGPCAVVSGAVPQEQLGARILAVVTLLARHKKLALLGGQVESLVWSFDELSRIAKLPPVGQMRAELVGVLEEPARALLAILQRSGGEALVGILEQHRSGVGHELAGVLGAHEENLKKGE
ncbi:hypothetical protein M427DRAFT_150780 [Gonapodya prolifera JEL478]|uniref:Ribosomal protein L10 n=1 Tax=Gonapodya prolifera (strain JEL478) TaxID=1344416 RepID=A0A139B0J9_GONPJ|nr:hypothetical protein M427DRAFT_150780 [Gonapodya prolifera JEL478]|eukprot:KXS22522.1 hypothetical protein M427DRAFT_150780 [Gonapodya prolifera JEL478]